MIPKHPLAGTVEVDADGKQWQIMHNGLRVEYGQYHGEYMAGIIAALRDHHEPQEEFAFWEILKCLNGAPTMVELGAFWAYYSLWFRTIFPSGRSLMYEPDAEHLAAGQRNFARNGFSGYVEISAAGLDGNATFMDETLNQTRAVATKGVATICREQHIDRIDLLHMGCSGCRAERAPRCRSSGCCWQTAFRVWLDASSPHLGRSAHSPKVPSLAQG